MSRKPILCGVILAAGASSRMGTDKALLPWPPASPASASSGNETLLSAAILSLQSLTETVVVVAGKNAEKIAPVVEACGAFLTQNPAPERGQFSSMQVGLQEALSRGCDAAMIALVDCPPLSAASLEKLSAAFERALADGKWGVAPEHHGKRGHPLFAGRELIEAFLQAPTTSNAREVKHAHTLQIESVPVPDAFTSVDVNTPEEYATLFPPSSAPPT